MYSKIGTNHNTIIIPTKIHQIIHYQKPLHWNWSIDTFNPVYYPQFPFSSSTPNSLACQFLSLSRGLIAPTPIICKEYISARSMILYLGPKAFFPRNTTWWWKHKHHQSSLTYVIFAYTQLRFHRKSRRIPLAAASRYRTRQTPDGSSRKGAPLARRHVMTHPTPHHP